VLYSRILSCRIGRGRSSRSTPLTSASAKGGENLTTAHEFLARRPHLIPAAIATAVLLGALCAWPYAYYQAMRWAVCAAALFIAWKGWTFKQTWAICVFGLLAVLFNPLIPFHIKRDTWHVIDLLAAAMFVGGLVVLRRPKQERQGGQ
jgi:hypothetical protein